MKYISLCRLQLRRPYKILQVSEENCHDSILLTLKEYGFVDEEEEFHSFLFSEFVPMLFLKRRKRNKTLYNMVVIYLSNRSITVVSDPPVARNNRSPT